MHTRDARSASVVAAAALAALAPLAAGQSLVPLDSYWSPGNGDNLCTSQASYLTTPPAGYGHYRTEGYVFSPNAPAGLIGLKPLHRWFNPVRGDYFTTSNPIWFGSAGSMLDGYTWNRLDGWVFPNPVAGTGDLRLYYSSSREDNFTTSDPFYTGYLPPSGYFNVASQGYIIKPAEGESSRIPAFDFGTLANGSAAVGSKYLAVFLCQYTDQPMRHTNAGTVGLLFGPAYPNCNGHFYANSMGQFVWLNGGVNGPFTLANEPDTTWNESRFLDTWDSTFAPFLYTIVGTANGVHTINCFGGTASTAFAFGSLRGANISETLVLADINGGNLFSGEQVGFKTFNKTFLRVSGTNVMGDAPSTAGSDARFTMTKLSGSSGTQVRSGDVVTLRSAATNMYLRAVGSGGSNLLADAAAPTPETSFTMYKSGVPVGFQLRECLRQAIAAGFNIDAFDFNHDGSVTNDELQFLVIGAGPAVSDGGGARDGGSYTLPGASSTITPGQVVGLGEDSSLVTVCHELSHALGVGYEMYGAFGAMNFFTALMGSTIFTNVDDRRTFMHDPWTRMRFGWLHPRIFSLSDAGAVATLEPADTGGESFNQRPILLYDRFHFNPDTGAGEFFMLEYRNSGASTNSYDANVASNGLAIWLCKTDASGSPVGVLSVLGACCTSAGCSINWDHNCTGMGVTFKGRGTVCDAGSVCPPGAATISSYDGGINILGAPGVFRGETTLWTAANQPAAGIVPVYTDGSPADVHIRVGNTTARSMDVEWSFGGNLPPRIDSCSSVRFRRGRLVTFSGMFGVRRPSIIVDTLSGTHTGTFFPVSSFSPTSLTGRFLYYQSFVLGTYNIYFESDTQLMSISNTVQVTVLHAADWNEDGAISVQDIFDFLASYFTDGADYNGNGPTTVDDLFDFLAGYFGGL